MKRVDQAMAVEEIVKVPCGDLDRVTLLLALICFSLDHIPEEFAAEYNRYNTQPLTIDDFELLKVLGKGSFGKVMLVKKKDDPSENLYALKTLRKAALVKRNQLAHTATERTILQHIRNPFLVHLVFAFQTPDKL
jgi:serine/threonine protein kinase